VNKKFLTAFALPEHFEFFGFKLKPLCIKSMLALHAIESPFVSGKEPSTEDILNFLRICSVDFNGFSKMKKRSLWEQFFYYKMYYWPIFRVKVMLCIKVFVQESSATPLVRIKSPYENKNEKVVKETQALPDLLVLATILMSRLGLSEKEALEIPIGRASCYASGIAALEGGEVIMVPEDESAEFVQEELANHEKAMAERMRLAMVNGKVPNRKIKTRLK
jgi:hypothetical protein